MGKNNEPSKGEGKTDYYMSLMKSDDVALWWWWYIYCF